MNALWCKFTLARFSILIITLAVSSLLAACRPTASLETPLPVSTGTPAGEGVAAPPQPAATEAEKGASEIFLSTPTPAPTATPGPITMLVGEFAARTGANQVVVLGLTAEDWLNIAVSLLIFVLLVFLVTRLVFSLLERAAARTKIKFDEELLRRIEPQIRWLVVIFALQYGTIRLSFISLETKTWLDRAYTALYILIFTVIVWRLIDTLVDWYRQEVEPAHPEHQSETLVVLVSRGARFFLLTISLTMLLSVYSINVGALIAALGVAGLAISLAAQDTLSNMISGVIILLDQPFRVGDRIEIQGLETWGDVVDIGLRSTRIRTRDNRMVIVPNAKIGSDQVINYSYPDTRYRIEMEIGIGYGEDVERVRRIIVDTVSPLEGVLQDMPVEALYVKIAENAMMFRIRWWIESYVDTRRMFDRVNTALQKALNEAGIVIPFPTYTIQMKKED